MRLRDEKRYGRSLLRGLITCASLALLTACNSFASAPPASSVTVPRANGPQADYPILIGPAYDVNGITYTPLDTLNYDEVGQAVIADGAMGITGAHHTLPVPSYVEVTSLETGRTILVRLEQRGPMTSNDLIALSPAAFAQLEAESGLEVRVRRVNPPEDHRAMLRAGDMAPPRMDTPMSLVTILRRKLPEPPPPEAPEAAEAPQVPSTMVEPLRVETPPPSVAAPTPDAMAEEPLPDLDAIAEAPAVAQPAPPKAPVSDGFFVQVAAFSTQERADRASVALDAHVIPGGRFFRVRTGPFATREEAAASLAKVRAAGYDDARILTGG